jgi:hypothetical protein
MYQRYYKQKRFGKIFSFFLVVGSGLSHYVRSSYKYIRQTVSLDNIARFSDYMPDNAKLVLETLKDKKPTDIRQFLKGDDIDFKKKYWIYENNINDSIKNRGKGEKAAYIFKENLDDIKNKETNYLYTYYKDKIL